MAAPHFEIESDVNERSWLHIVGTAITKSEMITTINTMINDLRIEQMRIGKEIFSDMVKRQQAEKDAAFARYLRTGRFE